MSSDSDLVDITIHEDMWLSVMAIKKWKDLFEQCCHLVLGSHTKENVSVCLVNDQEMTDLNTRYRSKSGPTNVLSFPQNLPGILGDIVLAYETIQKEALTHNKTFLNHVIHLFIHGLLHLKGYDHVTPEESQYMENLEIKALATLGIGNPYE